MFISPAMAGHFMADDGNTGGGDTLLIILGVGLVLGLLYVGQKKWRQRMLARQGESETQGQ
jgi:LPXTG-motif cell wall-anchored protein